MKNKYSMKDCMTPHVMLHALAGLGIGLLLAAVLGGALAGSTGIVLGLILIVASFVGHYMF